MHTDTRLQRADAHLFSTALPDSGSRLGVANMRYGLAKIHWVQERLGLPANATFISAPDLTVTRNTARWDSGFGYGGILTWGDGELDVAILDLKPNACGMLVGGLDALPPMEDLLARAHALKNEPVEIEGIPIEWDFGKGNHFIDLFRVEPAGDTPLPPYAFIMHFAGSELRGETEHGPGLCWDDSPTLRARMELFDTPFGPLRILTGDDARAYFEFYRLAETFVQNRRLYAASRLFDAYTPINNDTHQGLSHPNQILLGCYRFTDPNRLYPIALRPDVPAYLVRGKPNLTPETIETLGFEKRARSLGVYEQLTTANLLPHGGGYTFPHIQGVVTVHQLDGQRYFEVDVVTGSGHQLISGIRSLPYQYRGREVVLRTLELDMAEIAARLTPVYILKV